MLSVGAVREQSSDPLHHPTLPLHLDYWPPLHPPPSLSCHPQPKPVPGVLFLGPLRKEKQWALDSHWDRSSSPFHCCHALLWPHHKICQHLETLCLQNSKLKIPLSAHTKMEKNHFSSSNFFSGIILILQSVNHLFKTCHVPGTMLSTDETAVNKKHSLSRDKFTWFPSLMNSWC